MSINPQQSAQDAFDRKYRFYEKSEQERLATIYNKLRESADEVGDYFNELKAGSVIPDYLDQLKKMTIPNLLILTFQLANLLNLDLDEAIRNRREDIVKKL